MCAKKGVHLSEEHKRKISESHLGKHLSAATRRKIGMNKNIKTMLGKHHSPEAKKQISDTLKGRYLSEKHRKNMSMSHKGNKSWNWKGGITPLSVQIRSCFEYRLWRSDVFTRDNFTCVVCGQKGGYLEIDHYPKKLSVVIQENHIQSLEQAISCQEFWNVNNGRTVCKGCHARKTTKRRTQYGRIIEGRP
jgi:hypothetical protein